MNRWCGKVAVVTGASAGIGAAICEALVERCWTVVGFARRVDKLDQLSERLRNFSGKFYPRRCDLRNKGEVLDSFEWIKGDLGGVDVLVNNAGIFSFKRIIDDEVENFEEILDVNVLATAICVRQAVASMREGKVDGHVININSVSGHFMPHDEDSSLYTASKYAITGLTETVRRELIRSGSRIKITSVSPGNVETDIARATGYPGAEGFYKTVPHLEPKDIADAVLYILSTPENVQVTELTIRPVGEIV